MSVTLSGSETTFPPPAGDARRADVRITALEAIPFAVPYRRTAGFASGTVTTADNVLVRVHTDAGLVGQAEAQPRPYTYGETQASIVDTVGGALSEACVSPYVYGRGCASAWPTRPASVWTRTSTLSARLTRPDANSGARR